MTWPPRVPWWVGPLAALVAVGAVVWALNDRRGARRELAREKERHELVLAGLNVAADATRSQLADQIVTNLALVEEIGRIQAVAPGATPVAEAHGSTGVHVVGPPVATGPAPSTPPATPGAAPSPPGPASPLCLLLAGDGLELRAAGAALETRAGNIAVAATASAWRYPAAGGEPTRLLEAPLRLEVQTLKREAPPGWGVGPALFAGSWGWAVGAAAAFPGLRVWGLSLDVTAGAGVGPNGEWSTAVLAPVRW